MANEAWDIDMSGLEDLQPADQQNQDVSKYAELGIDMSTFSTMWPWEKDEEVKTAFNKLREDFILKYLSKNPKMIETEVRDAAKMEYKIDPNSTAEEKLDVLLKAKKKLDQAKFKEFVSTIDKWTQYTQAQTLQSMYAQLWANSWDEFKTKVSEMKSANDQYEKLDDWRDALIWVRANRLKNKLQTYLDEDPKKAMKLMFKTSRTRGTQNIRWFARRGSDRLKIWWSKSTNEYQIKVMKKITQDVIDKFGKFPALQPVLLNVANKYLASMKISHEFKATEFTQTP